MVEPMSDERLAQIREWVTERPHKVDSFTHDLLPEVDRLRKENAALKNTDAWEIVGTWIAERDAHMGNVTPYGIEPYSDAEPIIDLTTVYGWDGLKKHLAKEALNDAADAVPVDFWATYGMTPRRAIEGFQEWLRERGKK